MPRIQTEPDVSAAKASSPLARALTLLGQRSRSRAALAQLLHAEGYEAAPIEEAMAQVQAWGYLHDGRLADAVAHAALRRGKGPRWARAQLDARQIPAALASEAVADVEAQAQHSIAALMARRFAGGQGLADAKLRARAFRFLLGRGFTPGQIQQAWRSLGSTAEDACLALDD